MSETLVKVDHVSKKFCRDLKRSLWYGVRDLTSELVGRENSHGELRKDEFWAVDDVSFELNRGECLGLIGRNGAGKSTLLKMLNGLINPDKGRITIRGRTGALIELGAGFNPILTGRENIYVNAAVLGIPKQEVDKKLDSIIEFAEIGDFINTPVQHYSSGMRVRLGFAVAAQMQPDILLIDEVLAVGDIAFVVKCLNAVDRMMDHAAVIFVSHHMPFVSRICSHLIVMDGGKVAYNDTNPAKGIETYYSSFGSPTATLVTTGRAEILDVRLGSTHNRGNGQGKFMTRYLDDLDIEIDMKVDERYDNPTMTLSIYDKELRNVAECLMINGTNKLINKNGFISLRVTIPRFSVGQGVYTLTVALFAGNGREVLFRHHAVKEFLVSAPFVGWSPVQLKGHWQQLN